MRRARIISEPVTPYIRFEYDVTDSMNIAAGEQVRWLPRRRASDLALPGNDFWVFDDRLVHGSLLLRRRRHRPRPRGDGRSRPVIKLCAAAFEAVWERAIDHKDYRPA